MNDTTYNTSVPSKTAEFSIVPTDNAVDMKQFSGNELVFPILYDSGTELCNWAQKGCKGTIRGEIIQEVLSQMNPDDPKAALRFVLMGGESTDVPSAVCPFTKLFVSLFSQDLYTHAPVKSVYQIYPSTVVS